MADSTREQPKYSLLSTGESEKKEGATYEISVDGSVASHVGYIDESSWNTGRYRSVAFVSLPAKSLVGLTEKLEEAARKLGVSLDFKFKKVRDKKGMRTACEWIDIAAAHVVSQSARIDVLSWDTYDERHAVRGRDDSENLAYMNRKLVERVVGHRWPYVTSESTKWVLNPDEGTPFNWDILLERINSTAVIAGGVPEYEVLAATEIKSEKSRLVQLADVFAGVARYGRSNFDVFTSWSAGLEVGRSLTNGDFARLGLIKHLLAVGKKHRMPIKYSRRRGLYTTRPRHGDSDGLYFWPYNRQHPSDLAPRR